MNKVASGEGAVVSVQGQQVPAGWLWRMAAMLGVAACIVLIYHKTAWSMVSIWLRSDTFAHGFLIVPISLWLVYEKRDAVARACLQGAWLPIGLMPPVAAVWVVSGLVDVLVVQQFALVALVILGVWGLIGNPLARVLAFPLGFLFFAVPVGEGLVYPMMTFTADFTVYLLRATGIPVYREATFFSIPSGDWSVVEACSGVRYLIAAVTLGVLYAYWMYSKLWKRVVFMVFAVIVPVIGNGLRAYLIVMIGHWSDMTLAVGADHLVYGWVFFGIIISILFFVGSFWRDAPEPSGGGAACQAPVRLRRGLLIGLAAVAASATGPMLAWGTSQLARETAVTRLDVPQAIGGWRLAEGRLWDWQPHLVGADREVVQFYSSDGGPAGLYIGIYGWQRDGSELVSSANQVVLQEDPVWSERGRMRRSVDLAGQSIEVEQYELSGRTGERLLVWRWFRVAGWDGVNPYAAKLQEARERILAGRSDGAHLAAAVRYVEPRSRTEALLEAFVADMLPGIREKIDLAVGRQ